MQLLELVSALEKNMEEERNVYALSAFGAFSNVFTLVQVGTRGLTHSGQGWVGGEQGRTLQGRGKVRRLLPGQPADACEAAGSLWLAGMFCVVSVVFLRRERGVLPHGRTLAS